LEVDVPYQWLRFFEPSDVKLADIAEKYSSGEMLTGEIKQILIETLNPMLLQQQERRRAVSDDLVRVFMSVRPLQWNQIKPHPDYVPASAAEIESLKLEIEKQGGVVKGMKEAKAAKEDVTAAVQVLNALKEKVCVVYSSFPDTTLLAIDLSISILKLTPNTAQSSDAVTNSVNCVIKQISWSLAAFIRVAVIRRRVVQ
jgi:hypothetical protein